MIKKENIQTCKKCHNDKPITEFNKTSDRSVITRITTCKSCQADYSASYYALNKARVLDNQRYRRKQQKKYHDNKSNTSKKNNR